MKRVVWLERRLLPHFPSVGPISKVNQRARSCQRAHCAAAVAM